MARKIFVNLPIKDMGQSQAFFRALGFEFNPQFTNEQGACMVVSDTIYVMLLVEPFFQTFTKKPVADARKGTEVLVCLSCDSREEVDALVRKALAAGGDPAQALQAVTQRWRTLDQSRPLAERQRDYLRSLSLAP